MDKFGIKASLYDILGYIIPGLVFIVGLAVIHICKECPDKNFIEQEVGLVFGSVVLMTAYILGHVFGSFSSYLFEKKGKKLFARFYDIDPKVVGEKYRRAYDDVYGKNAEIEFRNVIAYSEEKTKAVYDTAFVFLSIYGLSRNVGTALFFVLLAYFIMVDFAEWNKWILLGLSFCIIALLHNYFRFKEYYIEQIFASLTVPLK